MGWMDSLPLKWSAVGRRACDSLLRVSPLLIVVLLAAWQLGDAQSSGPDLTSAAFEAGLRPFGSYHSGAIDAVNLVNGSPTIDIPLISYPQRGGKLGLNFVLHYQNLPWFEFQSCNSSGPLTPCTSLGPPAYEHSFQVIEKGASLGPLPGLGPFVQAVNSSVPSLTAVDLTGPHCQPTLLGSGISYSCAPVVVEPDGATHPLAPVNSGTYEAVDGSGYRMDFNLSQILANSSGASVVVTNSDGTRFTYPTSLTSTLILLTEDVNGNQISLNSSSSPNSLLTPASWTDTMGRVIPTPLQPTSSDSTGCSGPLPIAAASVWNPPGLNGGTYPIKFCYVSVSETLPAAVGVNPQTYNATQLQSVVLPDGHTWTFQYTTDGKGDLAQITFPTGGTLSYTWTDGRIANNSFSRAIQTRVLNPNDGGPTQTWSYTYGGEPFTNKGQLTTTVTDPAGNDTVHTFSTLGSGSLSLRFSQELKTQVFQGSASSGILLKTVQYDYQFTNAQTRSGASVPPPNQVPVRATTIWPNGQTSKVEYSYDQGFQVSCFLGSSYDTNGNPNSCSGGSLGTAIYGKLTSTTQYDFGPGAPSSVLQTTNTAYQFVANAAFLANNLLNLPAQTTVTDGSGNVAASATYGYDESSLVASGISSQHDASPPSGGVRGNLTSVNRFLDTDAKNVSTHTFWLDTGEAAQQVDPLGHTTSFSYDATGTYPSSVCNALNQCGSAVYDLNTGLVLSKTDANNQTTSFSYDQALRPTQIVDPPTPVNGSMLSGQATFSYPDAVTVQIQQTVDASDTRTAFLQVDGLGRKIRQATGNGESSNPFDQVDVCYDALGRINFQSYPFQGQGLSASRVCSGTGDTVAYDALSRTTSVTHSDASAIATAYTGSATSLTDEAGSQRISQTDGLGRLTSVCEVTSATQGGPNGTPYDCGQAIDATGFLTNYSYDALGNLLSVTQSGLNPRSFSYDSLSRLITASNPESGNIVYSYDANGNLLTRVAPAPNQNGAATLITNYVYDPLDRLTQKSYSDGVTPSVKFVYDAPSTWNNLSPQLNLTGRLSQESTASSSGALLTGSIFSYDGVGRVLANNQCTPLTCGTSSATIAYAYDLLGDLLSASNGAGITFSYANNSAGRLSSMSSSLVDASHPVTLFSGAHYGPFGLAQANLGNGYAVTRGYDGRGRVQSEIDAIPAAAASVTVTVGGSERTTQILTQPATPGTGSVAISGALQAPVAISNPSASTSTAGTSAITVNGSEQQFPPGATPGTGVITLSGTEQSIPPTTASGSLTINGTLQWAATGSVSIGGLEQSKSGVGAAPATAGTGTVVIGGPGSQWVCCDGNGATLYDSGNVYVTINGVTSQIPFSNGAPCCGGYIANYMVATINQQNPYVTAACQAGSCYTDTGGPGQTIVLTAKSSGANTNYSLSASTTYDSVDFSAPSFTATASAAALTGGTNANPGSTIFDAGTCSVTVNGVRYSTDFGANDNTSAIASRLASAIASGTLANATASGGTISLVAKQSGSAGTYSLSSSCTFDSSNFGSASFSAGASASGLSGGSNALFDSGTCSLTANGHRDPTPVWSGSGTSTSSIASALASAINSDSSASVTATSSGAVVSLTAKGIGSVGNYAFSSSCANDSKHFSSASFTTGNSGSALTGGKNTIFDAGTITVTVNSHGDSYTFSQTDTSGSIAVGLAAAINKDTGASVTAVVSGSSVTLTAVTTGGISNYPMSAQVGYDSKDFAHASFSVSDPSALAGGTPPAIAMDAGSLIVTVNNNNYSVSWGASDTPGSIASNLAAALKSDPTVAPTLSGSTILMNPRQPGTSYSFASNFTYDTSHFNKSSFAPAGKVYDYGTASVMAGGVTDKAFWSFGATSATIASALAGVINADPSAVVKATATSSGGISLTAKTAGANTNYALSSASTYDSPVFNTSSFTSAASAAALAGGQNAVFTPDSDKGTVAITISDPAIPTYNKSIPYGASDTSATVASALASGLHNDASSPVDATASGATITLTARAEGVASGYSFSINSASTDSNFSGASFPVSPGNGSLAGGANGFQYSFSIANPNGQSGYAGNGNVLFANDSVNGNWAYTYDSFNRLMTASQNSGQSGYSYVYDQFGNRLQQNVAAGAGFAMILNASGNNNRLDQFTYDAAGNLLNDGNHSYTYDGENRIISVDGGSTATYVYDAEGRRVQKTASGTTIGYLYDLAQHPAVELNSSGGWNRAEVYAAGRHLAIYSGGASGQTFFAHTDWLGTERGRTNLDGVMCETATSLPFGDGQSESGNCDFSPLHFIGKERDTESGLDDFRARYYSSATGRFTSPDPLLNSGKPWDPQSWNRYSYVRNNVLSRIDPTGLYDLKNTCNAADKKCNKQFQQHAKDLGNNLTNLQNKLKDLKDPQQKARLEAALKAFGTEGDHNGVNVTFGATGDGAAAKTDPVYNQKTGQETFNVTLDPNVIKEGAKYAIDAAHEGTHIDDIKSGISNPNLPVLSLFSLEYRGYQTSAWAAQALGADTESVNGNVIWNSSWKEADRATLQDRGITNTVTGLDPSGHNDHGETNPHNPLPN